MILGFVCCSNPSGSTNNNTLDYCDICDGVQDASHEHDYCLECDGVQGSDHEHQVVTPEPEPEPEVDYCDICDGVQDESHEHDYCLECDGVQGSDHEHQEVVTPTEPTYDEYFHINTIGGENSPYKVAYPDNYEYNELNDFTAVKKLNDYQNNYKKYTESLTFSDEFKSKYVTSIGYNTFDTYNNSANSIINVNESFDYLIENINNVCAPIFEEITKNIKISDNAALDKARFKYYYWAIENEAYKDACREYFDTIGKDHYENEKNGTNGIINSWEAAHTNRDLDVPFDLYITENGIETLNPEVIQQMDLMIQAAATRLQVSENDLRNVINLSITMDSLDAVHDYTSSTTNHTINQCPSNTMVDTIGNIKSSDMVAMQTKLNQLIFKRDLGREMC